MGRLPGPEHRSSLAGRSRNSALFHRRYPRGLAIALDFAKPIRDALRIRQVVC